MMGTNQRNSTSGGQEAERSDAPRRTPKRYSTSHPTDSSVSAKAVRLNPSPLRSEASVRQFASGEQEEKGEGLSPLRSVQQQINSVGHDEAEREVSLSSSSGSASSQMQLRLSPANNIRQHTSSSTSSTQASSTTMLTSTELARQLQDPRVDPEDLNNIANQFYLEERYEEALPYYHRSVLLSPWNTTYRTRYALTLLRLGRMTDGTSEFEAASGFGSVYPNPEQRLQHHVSACTAARLAGEWGKAFHEADAAIAAGSYLSPQLFMCKLESLLNLHQLEEAEVIAKKFPLIVAPLIAPQSHTYIFGMQTDAYTYFVYAQMEMAMGRFTSALTAAEKALAICPPSEVFEDLVRKIKIVSTAITKGNNLLEIENFNEACQVYEEGLKHDPSNYLLYCNRATCWTQLNRLDQAIDDCTKSLMFKANNIKALQIRAAAYYKLGMWKDAVVDYDILRLKLPMNPEIAISLGNAYRSRMKLPLLKGESVEMTFRHKVELVLNLQQFKTLLSGSSAFRDVSFIYFDTASNPEFDKYSECLDKLAMRYPTIHFLKVVTEQCEEVASAEMITVLPLLKLYKLGKEIFKLVRPTCQDLNEWARHYDNSTSS